MATKAASTASDAAAKASVVVEPQPHVWALTIV